MVSVSSALRVTRYQELNEPQVFSWRYLAKRMAVHYLFPFAFPINGGTIHVVVTWRWHNKRRKSGDLIAYDEENGYCLLGSLTFEKKHPTSGDVYRACREHGKAYVERLLYLAADKADVLHGESRKGYHRYKKELQRKLKKQGIYEKTPAERANAKNERQPVELGETPNSQGGILSKRNDRVMRRLSPDRAEPEHKPGQVTTGGMQDDG